MGLLSKAGSRAAGDGDKDPSPDIILETPGDAVESPHTLKDQIAQYNRIYADFNCIILDFPASSGKEARTQFFNKVSKMITLSGTVLQLDSGRPLILFPVVKDRELIAHRLSKSLSSKALLSCEASSPEDVINHLNSLVFNE